MKRIYVDASLTVGTTTNLDDRNSHYLLRVLRMRDGDTLTCFNGREAGDYLATLQIDKKQARLLIQQFKFVQAESTLTLTLIQAVTRKDRLDLIVQKATELGVQQIIIVNAERTQTPLKATGTDKKLAHWHEIAVNAAEQSGRQFIPIIRFYPRLSECIQCLQHDPGTTWPMTEAPPEAALPEAALPEAALPEEALHLLFLPTATTAAWPLANRPVYCWIGPEGGFSQAETAQIQTLNTQILKLGPRILRAETAAVAALTLCQHQLGDLR